MGRVRETKKGINSSLPKARAQRNGAPEPGQVWKNKTAAFQAVDYVFD